MLIKLIHILRILFLSTLLMTGSGFAESETKDPLTLNMQDAEIGALIETVSFITGKNFIVDPRVTGKITIVSAIPTEPEELYDLFLSVLRVYGYAAIENNGLIKIVPDTNAKFESNSLSTNELSTINDSNTTMVIKIENVNANDLIPILRPLLPQTAHLAAHNESNMLIASDYASNLDRLKKIIKRIDLDSDKSIEVIRLQHANASDLVEVILPNYQSKSAGKGKSAVTSNVRMIADDRTSSILLSGDKKQRLEIRALITHLDTPVEQLGDTEVIYLKYAVASEMVPVLQKLGGRLGVSDEERQQSTQKNASNSQNITFEIEADDNMNALIIHAPPKRLNAVKSVIKQLDIRRAQVLVEGVIAEVSYDRSVELGIQWQTNVPSQDGFFVGSSQSSLSESLAEGISNFNPLSLSTGLSLGFFSSGTLRNLIRAIEGDGYSNLLSTPTLMTMDNEEAEIVIGQNVPFVTGQFTNNTTTPDNPFQTIERQDVGILLKVKPQINEGDSVKLEIEQEISSVASNSTGADLITNKRSIKTNVMIDDGEVVVLGGLLEDDMRESEAKVPVLGNIPVLGALFRNTRDQIVKTNLMIFLRPQIVRDLRTSSRLTNSKYKMIRNEQKKIQDEGLTLMPSMKITELPPYEEVQKSSDEFLKSGPGKLFR